jgi:DNA topoisomerase-3
LYLQGYTTYPRTETTSYPKNFNFKPLVEGLTNHSEHRISTFAKDLLNNKKMEAKKGKDHGDHPPITITSNIPSGLSGGEDVIYQYIASNFLASIAPDLKYEEVKYECAVGNLNLAFSEKILKEAGFKQISKNIAWRNEYK